MKKDFIKTIKILLTAVVLSLGISYVYAWTAPTVAPPGGNTPEPVNLGTEQQDKVGNFRAGGLRSFGDLMVDGGITLGGVRETSWPSVPSGAVLAFDLASCPSGWSEYTSARDRTIIGSGGSYNRGVTGGESSVTLSIAQMPSHNHGGGNHRHSASVRTGNGDSDRSRFRGSGDNTTVTVYTDYSGNIVSYQGGGQPHNNMQPYIALLYCVKD